MTGPQDILTDAGLETLLTSLGRGNAQWALHVHNFESGASGSVQGDVLVDTMSVIKVPLLLHLLELAYRGEVNLSQRLRLTRDRKRFGTGVLATLDDGLELTLRDAAELMITVSDNTATDIVFDAVGGPQALNAALAARGFCRTKACGTTFEWLRHLATSMDSSCATYSPEELFVKGYPLSNSAELRAARARYHFGGGPSFGLTTAAEFGTLLAALEAREYSAPKVCEQALHILGRQNFRSRIPRYLPPEVTVVNKTGDFSPFIANDSGVARAPGAPTMVFCIFSSRHTQAWGYAEEVIARSAEACWKAMTQSVPSSPTPGSTEGC